MQRESKDVTYGLHPSSLDTDLLFSHGTFVKTRELTLPAILLELRKPVTLRGAFICPQLLKLVAE